jgi:glycine cleavage system H protein
MTPENLRYAESHEWVKQAKEEGPNIAVIGITDFAVHQLSDVVFMQLPDVGTKVTAGKEFGEVESVKAVSPLYSPVSGEIVAVNTKLPENLELLQTDPYGQGWMIKIAMSNEKEVEKLLDNKAYEKQCES